jgi:hypothetical protein
MNQKQSAIPTSDLKEAARGALGKIVLLSRRNSMKSLQGFIFAALFFVCVGTFDRSAQAEYM